MSELNPNHPVTQKMRDEWHKLCAILLFKSGKTEIDITSLDIQRFASSGLCNIVNHAKNDRIVLRLVSDKEAAKLAREEGGLPV